MWLDRDTRRGLSHAREMLEAEEASSLAIPLIACQVGVVPRGCALHVGPLGSLTERVERAPQSFALRRRYHAKRFSDGMVGRRWSCLSTRRCRRNPASDAQVSPAGTSPIPGSAS
jgi:hypothetical protein